MAETIPALGASVNASEKQDAVARVLNSPEMAAAPRARDFLRYVVGEEIGGRADLLKGYTIATEALGRREAFDADTAIRRPRPGQAPARNPVAPIMAGPENSTR